MLREFIDYLALDFPEGVFKEYAPESFPPPFLTVKQTEHEYDDALGADASQSQTATVEVTVWVKDRASLAPLLERLRRRVNRPGEVFDLWGVSVGLMRIASEDETLDYIDDAGERTLAEHTVTVQLHYERI